MESVLEPMQFLLDSFSFRILPTLISGTTLSLYWEVFVSPKLGVLVLLLY